MTHALITTSLILIATSALAAEENTVSASINPHRAYDILFTAQGGPFKAKSITISNNEYNFAYDGDSLSSVYGEMGWGYRLFEAAGTSVYASVGLGLSFFKTKLPVNFAGNSGNQSLTLTLFVLDPRVIHSWDTFLASGALVPFWEAGYQHSFYSQNGPSDLTTADGGVGNFVAAAGLRYWLNKPTSVEDASARRYSAIPIFLTAKVNRVFPSTQSLNLENTTVLGGLTVGL